MQFETITGGRSGAGSAALSSAAAGRPRQPANARPVRVICISGGKGGVGKTCVAVNLASALVEQGQRVMLLDADLGLANVGLQLGMSARHNLSHVISGEKSLGEIVLTASNGLQVVPGGSGLSHMTRLSLAEQAGLIHAFNDLPQAPDVLVVDTAAGIDASVCHFCRAAQQTVIVVTPDPASLTDAYALIKVLNQEHGVGQVQVLANRVQDGGEGERVFRRLAMVTERYLDVTLQYAGHVPEDPRLMLAVREQVSLFSRTPNSPAARALRKLAGVVNRWPWPTGVGGDRVEFFLERVLQSGQRFVEYAI